MTQKIIVRLSIDQVHIKRSAFLCPSYFSSWGNRCEDIHCKHSMYGAASWYMVRITHRWPLSVLLADDKVERTKKPQNGMFRFQAVNVDFYVRFSLEYKHTPRVRMLECGAFCDV